MPFPYTLRVNNKVDAIIGRLQEWADSENDVLLDALIFADKAGFFRDAKKKHQAAARQLLKKKQI